MDLRPLINLNIEESLKDYLIEIGGEKGFTVETIEIVNESTVTCIVSAPPAISVSYIAKMLKGISARKILEQYPDLKDKLYDGRLWNTSYYVETIGDKSQVDMDLYIIQQKKNK